jgi:hypothetical protein
MNWYDLAQKKIWAPFIPTVTNEFGVRNFPDEPRRMISSDSPDTALSNTDDVFRVRTNCLSHFMCNA